MKNDDKLRQRIHMAADDCFSGVAVTPSQQRAVFERIEEMPRSSVSRKPSYALAFALLLMLALAGAAVAAGLGLFGSLREGLEDEMSYNRLGLLEEAAVTIGQTTAIGDYGELTIDQAYCDGRRLYYSYTIRKNDALASLYLGDGAKLKDGTELSPVDSWIEAVDDFTTAAYYEVALPEDFAHGESVRMTLTAIYHREEGTLELIDIPAEIPVTEPRMTLTGEGSADGYPAKAELYVSDVDVYGTVEIAAPEDYSAEGYALIADGEEYPNLDWGFDYENGTHKIKVRFDLPAGMESMTLMPWDTDYAHEAIELTRKEANP